LITRQSVPSIGKTGEEVNMSYFKIRLVIKNLIAFLKVRKKQDTPGITEYPDVKHPAEFLVRW